jgi:hypothetical protein
VYQFVGGPTNAATTYDPTDFETVTHIPKHMASAPVQWVPALIPTARYTYSRVVYAGPKMAVTIWGLISSLYPTPHRYFSQSPIDPHCNPPIDTPSEQSDLPTLSTLSPDTEAYQDAVDLTDDFQARDSPLLVGKYCGQHPYYLSKATLPHATHISLDMGDIVWSPNPLQILGHAPVFATQLWSPLVVSHDRTSAITIVIVDFQFDRFHRAKMAQIFGRWSPKGKYRLVKF